MDYKKFTNLIIEKVEGGYYHPDMKSKLKNGDRMGISGETLFGLDRANGGTLVTTGKGPEFWALVDSVYGTHHGDISYYNNKPTGATGQKLRNLAAEIMFAHYNSLASRFLSAKSQAIINKYPSLQINFYYAAWNGSGHFQKYANTFNSAVASGVTSENALKNVVINARLADNISHTAEYIKTLWKNMPSGGSSKKWLWLILGGAALIYLGGRNNGRTNNAV